MYIYVCVTVRPIVPECASQQRYNCPRIRDSQSTDIKNVKSRKHAGFIRSCIDN